MPGFGNDWSAVRAHAYGLLRTMMGTAASDGKISLNPCVIRGAGTTRRVIKIRPASLRELEKITSEMPEPYQAMILLASWCALRFGELTELRRRDVVINADAQTGVIRVERGVVRVGDGFQVTTPKSEAGIRYVAIPPHLVPVVQAHLAQHVERQADALLFPAKHGGHLAPPPSTASSTKPATPPTAQTYVSMICGIPARSWQRPRVPPWPN
jgi:integrase